MKHTERPGLYIMVFFILLNSCSAAYDAREAHKHAHAISVQLGIDPDDVKGGE